MTEGLGKCGPIGSSRIDAKKNSVALKEHDAKFEFGFGGIKAKPNSMLRAAQSTKRQSRVSRVSFVL
jgi:hypothetical protein